MSQIYQMNQTRNMALGLLAKRFKTSKKRIMSDEIKLWDQGESVYPLLIRKVLGGAEIDEAIKEVLEPEEPEEKTIQNKQVVVDGDIECPKCHSKKILREEKQTRSCDESQTVFCHCTSCGKRWKF